MTRPVALTIAGSDSSGGAGIQADLKTFSALRVYGATAITALTAQNTTGVSAIHIPPPAFLKAQIEAVTSDLTIAATKTGMLPTPQAVRVVSDHITAQPDSLGALIVDPVIVATSGDRLIDEEAVAALIRSLLPLTDLLTPNIDEAAMLLDAHQRANTDEQMIEQGRALLQFGCRAVLMKGGHVVSEEARDILVTSEVVEIVSGPRVETKNTHGTGCTLSAAIAANLALSRAQSADSVTTKQLLAAVQAAKQYLTAAIQAGAEMDLGQGAGPVDHLTSNKPT